MRWNQIKIRSCAIFRWLNQFDRFFFSTNHYCTIFSVVFSGYSVFPTSGRSAIKKVIK